MRIDRYFGRSLVFDNGLSIGFNWMHCSGVSTKSCATLIAYHHPRSITWRFALRWTKPSKLVWWPQLKRWVPSASKSLLGNYRLTLPLVGTLTLDYQPHTWRTSGITRKM